jgi:hypothetical protein
VTSVDIRRVPFSVLISQKDQRGAALSMALSARRAFSGIKWIGSRHYPMGHRVPTETAAQGLPA